MSSVLDLLTGAFFVGQHGHYESVCELRRGGMGVVILANVVAEGGSAPRQSAQAGSDPLDQSEPAANTEDLITISDQPTDQNQVQVVIKISLRADDHARARMDQEITALQALQHPQVVSVVDSGLQGGHAWYAMEYVGPCNMGDILLVRGEGVPSDLPSIVVGILDGDLGVIPRDQRIGLPVSTAVALMIQVAETVAHAHNRGVLHRDLKPANILLDDSGAAVLCDFGVARAQGYDQNLTAVDEVVGTIDYISPEQLAGAKPDERSDIYAMGAMLHESLSGQLPPRRQSTWEPLPALRKLPPPLVAIVNHALHPDPAKRLRSAGAFAADLLRFQQGQKVLAPLPLRGARFLALCYRHPLSSGFALMMLVLIGLFWWAAHQQQLRQVVVWQAPVVDYFAADLEPSKFNDPQPLWTVAPHGQTGLSAGYPRFMESPANSRHSFLFHGIPPRSGQRVLVEVDTRAGDQEVTVFLSATPEKWDSGYIFQLGGYNNTCAILRRGSTILWMGAHRIEPNQRIQVFLERHADRLRAGVDGQVLVEQQDPLPQTAVGAGIATYLYGQQEYLDPPIYRRFQVQTSDLPQLVNTDRIFCAYAAAAESWNLSTPGRAAIGRRGIRKADAMAMRLADDDPRKAMLRLRQEGLRRLSGMPLEEARDLSIYRHQLKDSADYYSHQFYILGEQTALRRELLAQAYEHLSSNEQARFVFTIEQRLRPDEWSLFLDDILQISASRPLEYDYVLWRVLSLAPLSMANYRRYWELREHLSERATNSFWALAGRQALFLFHTWREIRAGATVVNDDQLINREFYLPVIWQKLCESGSWDEAYEMALAQRMSGDPLIAVQAAVLNHRKEPAQENLSRYVLNGYRNENWPTYQTLLLGDGNRPLSPLDQDMRARHLAVALLLGLRHDEVLLSIPFHLSFLTGSVIEVLVAGVAAGHFPPSVLGEVYQAETPAMDLLRWLRDKGPLAAMPPSLSLDLALGPILTMAQAQYLHDLGEFAAANKLLESLVQDRGWLPTTEAAAAITRWRWP